jgi:hypothetical protein
LDEGRLCVGSPREPLRDDVVQRGCAGRASGEADGGVEHDEKFIGKLHTTLH